VLPVNSSRVVACLQHAATDILTISNNRAD
jgi:hypothetical protein